MSCSKCGKQGVKELFPKTQRGKNSSYCNECHKKYSHEYYLANRERCRDRDNARRRENLLERKRWLEKIKDGPCTDCNVRYPSYVLHFDHLRDKIKNVSGMIRDAHSYETIQKEIEKCELVCANCHAIRTHNRRLKS